MTPEGYDITNPFHYTLANKGPEFYALLTQKYQVNVPYKGTEMVAAAQDLYQKFGDRFEKDMVDIHPDLDVFKKHYGSQHSNATPVETPKIPEAPNTGTPSEVETKITECQKTQNVLLFGIFAGVLMIIGSKLLKN